MSEPEFRVICEEIYAQAVPVELLDDPRYEWRVFPDLGGDYPLIYVHCDGEYLPLPAQSDEGRAVLGAIKLESLHEQAMALYEVRQRIYAALDDPPSAAASGLYRMFQAIAAHASAAALSPFTPRAVADRILASHFDPEEIALDLGPYRDDVVTVARYISEREAGGENYWHIIEDLL